MRASVPSSKFYARNMLSMHQGRYKKAVEALNTAKSLTKTPDFSILCDLASCHAYLKEYSTAEDYCKEAGRICKTKEVYKLLSTCLVKQNKIGEAIEMFRLALR
jgi:tetratricopeptide (TPR) repeat protein